MTAFWVLALLLLIMGFGLAVLEVFFPSGGILGFLSFCSIVGAVIFGFKSGTGMGVGVLATAIVGVPTTIILALQWLPDTAVGRKIILHAPTSDEVLPEDERNLKALVGKAGKAKSEMLPAGAVRIEGRTIDCVSEGMAIQPGQWVRVIEVRGNRVVVRPVEEGEIAEVDPDDPLSKPIDSVLDEPFDEENEPSG
jgi:membrane-bound serine protease (ClpP class)